MQARREEGDEEVAKETSPLMGRSHKHPQVTYDTIHTIAETHPIACGVNSATVTSSPQPRGFGGTSAMAADSSVPALSVDSISEEEKLKRKMMKYDNRVRQFLSDSEDDGARARARAQVRERERGRVMGYASDNTALLGLAHHKQKMTGLRTKPPSFNQTGDELTARGPKTRRGRSRSRSRSGVSRDVAAAPPVTKTDARVGAYCSCDQIALFKLMKWLEKPSDLKNSLGLTNWKSKMYMGVIHSALLPQNQQQSDSESDLEQHDLELLNAKYLPQKHAFYFATGCCVFWGLSRDEELVHLKAISSFCSGEVAQMENEDMRFCYGTNSHVENDVITLSSVDVAEKLALSFAMAQSAKLDVFEDRVDLRIETTRHIPFNLATKGSIQYSQKDISRLIGQLFIELADVNLHSDILDEPDLLWEDDKYEPLYKRMIKYLDVPKRVKILNKRLDILRELVEVLNQQLRQQHGTKLEWIIIWLLVVEVVIAVLWDILTKDILGFFNHSKSE